MKHQVSIWAHVVLPICVAVLVFLLVIVLVILWSRCKRRQYKRGSVYDDQVQRDIVHNVVMLPGDQCPSPDCTEEGGDGDDGDDEDWTMTRRPKVKVKAGVGKCLIPRGPLALDGDPFPPQDCELAGVCVLPKTVTVETVDEGLGDDDTDGDRRSRSSSSGGTDCPPESLESPRSPSTASQHDLLHVQV
ncbi:hypothetical protein EGW08_014481 [Elysia chlorotica]|uniref:Uncharacterized protein n=1 Tax=Elysia chlorotica TaxID=188477 RepID=A0A433T841_ELYCH|nr:hypothetical protein EGW08_014481 [Elysia chlorotica]